jgi:hypothetical protein
MVGECVLQGGNILEAVAGHHSIIMVGSDGENSRILDTLLTSRDADIMQRRDPIQIPTGGFIKRFSFADPSISMSKSHGSLIRFLCLFKYKVGLQKRIPRSN